MQTTIDYQIARVDKLRKIGKTETLLRRIFTKYPEFAGLKNSDRLIRHIWRKYGYDYKANTILRVSRKLRATGEFDTVENQMVRANTEVAFREYARL